MLQRSGLGSRIFGYHSNVSAQLAVYSMIQQLGKQLLVCEAFLFDLCDLRFEVVNLEVRRGCGVAATLVDDDMVKSDEVSTVE